MTPSRRPTFGRSGARRGRRSGPRGHHPAVDGAATGDRAGVFRGPDAGRDRGSRVGAPLGTVKSRVRLGLHAIATAAGGRRVTSGSHSAPAMELTLRGGVRAGRPLRAGRTGARRARTGARPSRNLRGGPQPRSASWEGCVPALASMAEPVESPPELKARVMAAVAAEPRVATPRHRRVNDAGRLLLARRRCSRSAGRAAGACRLASAGLGVVGGSGRRSAGAGRRRCLGARRSVARRRDSAARCDPFRGDRRFLTAGLVGRRVAAIRDGHNFRIWFCRCHRRR